jgi:dynein heavy chain
MPKGKQFFFDSGLIFGQFEKYGRRLEKLIDMFSSIQQFSLLESQHVDGLQDITAAFFKLTKQFEKKGHDLLDHTATAFERDFVEFTMHNSALENKIQSFIDTALGTTKSSNIDQSLDLLTKFKKILHREALQDDLNHKYMQIFKSYGKQLIQIKEIYEQNKHNPPLGRNVTKIAGSIL